MAGSPKVWVRPAEGQVCPLPMGEGDLALDGLEVIFGGHWRLMEKRGLCVVTVLKEANDARGAIADNAEEKALRLVEMANRARATADAALIEAKKLRKLADESDVDTKKRLADERKLATANRKNADAEAARQDKAKREANTKAVASAAKDIKKGGGKK